MEATLSESEESVLIVCSSFSLRLMFLASNQQSVANISTSNQLAGWPLHVGHCYAHGLCVKCHSLLKTALPRPISLHLARSYWLHFMPVRPENHHRYSITVEWQSTTEYLVNFICWGQLFEGKMVDLYCSLFGTRSFHFVHVYIMVGLQMWLFFFFF